MSHDQFHVLGMLKGYVEVCCGGVNGRVPRSWVCASSIFRGASFLIFRILRNYWGFLWENEKFFLFLTFEKSELTFSKDEKLEKPKNKDLIMKECLKKFQNEISTKTFSIFFCDHFFFLQKSQKKILIKGHVNPYVIHNFCKMSSCDASSMKTPPPRYRKNINELSWD